MKRFHFACLFLVLISTMMLAKSNPVPLIAQPLVPASVAPGHGAFTLTVNGAGFGPNAAVYWNGSIRSTTVLSDSTVQAQINAADVANKGTAWVTVANPGAAFSNVAYLPIRDSDKGLGFLHKNLAISNVGPVVVGDFNNDGKLDVAMGNKNGTTLDIFLGRGNGTFKAPIVTRLKAAIVYMVAGDFNGDGNLDLAVLQFFNIYRITVFLGNGDGTFTKKTTFNAEPHATLLSAADFDGDGKLDLYVNGSDRYDGIFFRIKLGNGDGTFKDSNEGGYFGDYCIDGPPAIGDFNGDGLLDIAAVDSCSGVEVFLNNGNSFQGQSYPTKFGGSYVAAADVNGDGKVDLVTDGVSVLLGNGDGTFKDGGGTLSHGGGSVNVGDFNGDGKLDIASGLRMLLGNGDGTFQKPLTFAGLFSPGPLSMGDFNGDGKLDLLGITSNATLALFEQVRVYLTPIKLDFGVQGIGKTSRPRAASLTNFDRNSLIITGIDITGKNSNDFAQTNDCGSGLPPNGSCHIKVTFTPSLKGQEDASLNVTYKSSGTLTMPLTGIGEKLVTTVTLKPSSLRYAVQLVGTKSRPQTATLTNTGNQLVKISSIMATAQFSQTNNCPSSLPVGGSCQIQVVFSPTDPGNIKGTLSVADDAEGSPQTVALSGVGTIVTLSPTGVNFGNQKIGTQSVPIPITLSNVGSVTLTISQIAIRGANASDFAQTNDCGSSVPPQGHCTITVTFTPTVKGHRSAKVSISDDGGDSPQIVPLAGTGT